MLIVFFPTSLNISSVLPTTYLLGTILVKLNFNFLLKNQRTDKNHFQVLISFHTFVPSNYRSNSKSLPYEDSPNDEKKCFIL